MCSHVTYRVRERRLTDARTCVKRMQYMCHPHHHFPFMRFFFKRIYIHEKLSPYMANNQPYMRYIWNLNKGSFTFIHENKITFLPYMLKRDTQYHMFCVLSFYWCSWCEKEICTISLCSPIYTRICLFYTMQLNEENCRW